MKRKDNVQYHPLIQLHPSFVFIIYYQRNPSIRIHFRLTVCIEEEAGGPDERPYKRVKKFSVNGTILLEEYESYFVLDQAEDNKPFLKHIDNNGFVSYHAPRASGKSTRMLQLVKQLENGVHMIDGFKKFECF
ncbi:hypothetical protein BC938DRAFT_474880 [Jimgerdemannia flammicorona]|uniref:Uncharacterized protein n=1 Tax=Jimgerdemannia flammicorona TaxID=994334 RepID=A0A433Q1E2_9FUNG|nr:hypothetical protein BC938DRAFT_474880 [Jimgerdemannia flammicorona]